jgi:hypothetical protein
MFEAVGIPHALFNRPLAGVNALRHGYVERIEADWTTSLDCPFMYVVEQPIVHDKAGAVYVDFVAA